jgi:N-acetylglucosaminyldiphosphoundecaprenol N-acetyl-beta-D-mannosaminyltransferase
MTRERFLPPSEGTGAVDDVRAPSGADPSYKALGVTIHALDMAELNRRVEAAVASGAPSVIGHHNLHSVYLARRDPHMQAFYRLARWIHVDGMPLVFVARLLGHPLRRTHRVTYVDWSEPLLALAAQNGWRVFFLGSRPETVRRGADAVRARHALELEAHHGYFDATPGSPENGEVLDRIAAFRPDLLLVGMGMPRQERWVVENRDRIRAEVIITCGAMMDYVAGTVPTPPRWMGGLGLEWLYRLMHEPRRLFARYLVEPWFLVGPLARDLWRQRIRKPATEERPIRPAPPDPNDDPTHPSASK